MTKYVVRDARVIFPEGKVAERNPDLFAVVHGKFVDAKGQPLTITQKRVTLAMAKSPEFTLAGPNPKGEVTLALPSGKRGRKAAIGATADTIAQRLAAIRKA